ncbi:unnamed protein product, partial [Polarella glacialis]
MCSGGWVAAFVIEATYKLPPSLIPACDETGGVGVCYASNDVNAWTPELLELKAKAEEPLNRYDGGDEWLGWHSDREASISLGATRRFGFRLKMVPGKEGECETARLGHGSLCIMLVLSEESWFCLRKGKGVRVNLTFRSSNPTLPAEKALALTSAMPSAATGESESLPAVGGAQREPLFVGLTPNVSHTTKGYKKVVACTTPVPQLGEPRTLLTSEAAADKSGKQGKKAIGQVASPQVSIGKTGNNREKFKLRNMQGSPTGDAGGGGQQEFQEVKQPSTPAETGRAQMLCPSTLPTVSVASALTLPSTIQGWVAEPPSVAQVELSANSSQRRAASSPSSGCALVDSADWTLRDADLHEAKVDLQTSFVASRSASVLSLFVLLSVCWGLEALLSRALPQEVRHTQKETEDKPPFLHALGAARYLLSWLVVLSNFYPSSGQDAEDASVLEAFRPPSLQPVGDLWSWKLVNAGRRSQVCRLKERHYLQGSVRPNMQRRRRAANSTRRLSHWTSSGGGARTGSKASRLRCGSAIGTQTTQTSEQRQRSVRQFCLRLPARQPVLRPPRLRPSPRPRPSEGGSQPQGWDLSSSPTSRLVVAGRRLRSSQKPRQRPRSWNPLRSFWRQS